MVSNIKLVLADDTLLTYETENGRVTIPFSEINSYWSYANEEDVEGVRVYVHDDDKTLLILLTTASGQGGVVVGWDTDTRTIVHVSEASYVIALDYYDNYIYTLRLDMNFSTPAHFSLAKAPYGVKDAWSEPEYIPEFMLSEIDQFTGSFDDVDLFVNEKGINVRLQENTYHCMTF